MNYLTSNSFPNQTGLGYNIYVVSEETKEIIIYHAPNSNATFEGVIDNLKKLGKPSNLFYYNGSPSGSFGSESTPSQRDINTTQIKPTDKINSYLPTRRNQVIFWASSGRLEFPVVQPKENNIFVLMITYNYKLLSFDVPGSTDINKLISHYRSLVKFSDGNQTKITGGTLSENLPFRTNQIIFLLGEKIHDTEPYEILGSYQKMIALDLDKKIDLTKDYRLGKLLGAGSFGTVYFAKDLKMGFGNVAIKLIETNVGSNKSNLNSELTSWKKISSYPTCNKYIICLYDFGTGTINGKKYFVLIMEYIENSMELYKLSKKFIMNARTVGRILNDLVIGLREMHKQGVYHKDIKNHNILVSLSNDNSEITHVKYIDFGLSCIFDKKQNKICNQVSGTITYMSAELINKKETSSLTEDELRAIDIYALGVTMYKIFNRHPYNKAVLRARKLNDFFMTERYDSIIFKALGTDIEPLYANNIEGFSDLYKRFYLAKTITSLVNPDMNERLTAFDAIKTQDMTLSSSSNHNSTKRLKSLTPVSSSSSRVFGSDVSIPEDG